MITFDNDESFNKIMPFLLEEIIDEVAQKVLWTLEECIWDEVYSVGEPSPFGYKRQSFHGGLVGSLEKTKSYTQGKMIQSEVYHNPELLNIDPEHFIHGSTNKKGESNDIRDILADMIINGDSGTPHVGDRFGEGFWREPRDFWTPFLELLENGKVDNFIEQAFEVRGIQWIKG